MSLDDPPELNLLLDDTWARHHTKRALGDRLHTLREQRDEYVSLLVRLIRTSLTGVEDLVFVAGFARQVLIGLDGYLLAAEAGAAQTANQSLRVMLEALIYLEYCDLDEFSLRTRRCYIGHVRAKMAMARMNVPGTREHERYARAWKAENGVEYELSDERVAYAKEAEGASMRVLQLEAYRDIVAEFDAYRRMHRHQEAKWYQLGAKPARSINDVAKAVRRDADYLLLYSWFSQGLHSSELDLHFVRSPDDNIEIKRVRDPALLANMISFAVALPIYSTLALIRRYRPDEEPVFRERYMNRWKDSAIPVSVKYKLRSSSNTV
jgi:hypothetical protein